MVRSLKSAKKGKKSSKKKGGSSTSSAPPAKVWRAGVDALEEGEELQCDYSLYNYLRQFNVGCSCLSFDILRDSLGLVRTEFPHTLYGVAGTQDPKASDNFIAIFKLSNISGKKRKLLPPSIGDENEMESDSSSDDEEEEDDNTVGGSTKPISQINRVAHHGGINRIRAMSQKPHICATWDENGSVEIWDFSSFLNALPHTEIQSNRQADPVCHPPIFKFTGHKNEGFAIDWSPVVPGRLVSGGCDSSIYLWNPSPEKWNVDKKPFGGHTGSVEDLQWSPTEPDVFASCSVDGTVKIWDTRTGREPAVSVKTNNTDVNVISWNRLASCMIASGSDDGSFSIRDLRLIKAESLVAHFEYHKQPISSIEWSPHEPSTLAVSSADDQLTVWDLSLERDEEEEAEFKSKLQEQANAPEDLPPQLLFVHQGQKDLKELHWHSQIPGMILSTAEDSFNILMPVNLESTIPAAG